MVYTYDEILKQNKYNFSFITAVLKCMLLPVEDKPGYYWFSKRNCQIISEQALQKAINEYGEKLENNEVTEA